MGRRNVLVCAIAAVALPLVGCAGSESGGLPTAPSALAVASAPNGSLTAILENAPFKGEDSGSFQFLQAGCAAGLQALTTHTTGTATLIGAYTFETQECFDLNVLAFTGSFTIAAANGDTIVGTYTGHITGFLDNVTSTYAFTAPIAGGTGRFAGATGEISGTGQGNLATFAESRAFSGTISAVPRSRS